jgi:hypothetical protein
MQRHVSEKQKKKKYTLTGLQALRALPPHTAALERRTKQMKKRF